MAQPHLETWLAPGCGKPIRTMAPSHASWSGTCAGTRVRVPLHGFARARCSGCGHDFLIVSSCKGRGVCPSCNTRRMALSAAPLVDPVFPQVPMRQWVFLPKLLFDYHIGLNRAILPLRKYFSGKPIASL